MNLAPIGITTYSRINHLTKTVNSLKLNSLAKQSELYIFLDAPKVGDEKIVAIVRKYIYQIDGFKKVNIIERETNDAHKNAVDGLNQLLLEYGKTIFMEDDNVVSKTFLEYMNDGLNFYKDDKSIYAINGYNLPVTHPSHYKFNYYKSMYFNGWTFATWIDRGHMNIIENSGQYSEIKKDKKLYKKIKKTAPFIIPGLKLIHKNKIKAGDFKITFHQLKYNLYVIKPLISLVDNNGHDGSGIHCNENIRFKNHILNNKKIQFKKFVNYDSLLDLPEYLFHMKSSSFYARLKNKILKYIKR